MTTTSERAPQTADRLEQSETLWKSERQLSWTRAGFFLPVQRVAEILRYRGLLWNLVLKDFEIRYTGSVLGVLWTQLYPLLQLIVYGFVFTVIFHNSMEDYPLFLFIGIIIWTFFSTSLLTSASSLLANIGLITKVYFPRELAPLSAVIVAFVDLTLSHLVLFAACLYYGSYPTFAWLLAPAILILLGLFSAGCGLILSVATVYFHDVKYFLEVSLLLLFFLTPVVYPPEAVPPPAGYILAANPVATILTMYRGILINGTVPTTGMWLHMLVADLVVWIVGLHVFYRAQRGVSEVL